MKMKFSLLVTAVFTALLVDENSATIFFYNTIFNPSDIPENATVVYFDGVKINTIPPRMFSHLRSCRELTFNDTGTSEIEPDAWMGLNNLQELQIEYNEITTVRNEMFRHLTFLSTLRLKRNGISTIEPDAWMGLNGLRRLDISHNSLLTIWNGTFKHLTLGSLVLIGNPISEIEPGAFSSLTQLSNLAVSLEGPVNFTASERLSHDENESLAAPGPFFRLLSLHSIHLDLKYVTTIKSGIQDKDNKELAPNEFRMDILRDLPLLFEFRLSGNGLKTIESDAWIGLESISVLELTETGLEVLPPDRFRHLNSLITLVVTHNAVSTVQPVAFNHLSSLEYMYLMYNEIDILYDNAFLGLTNLRSLNLYDNKISTIEAGAFHGLVSLEELRLFGNQIETLMPNTFQGMPQLTFLMLSNNNLKTLERNIFGSTFDVDNLYLYLINNPLYCDEKMQWLMDLKVEKGGDGTAGVELDCVNLPKDYWDNYTTLRTNNSGNAQQAATPHSPSSGRKSECWIGAFAIALLFLVITQ